MYDYPKKAEPGDYVPIEVLHKDHEYEAIKDFVDNKSRHIPTDNEDTLNFAHEFFGWAKLRGY